MYNKQQRQQSMKLRNNVNGNDSLIWIQHTYFQWDIGVLYILEFPLDQADSILSPLSSAIKI